MEDVSDFILNLLWEQVNFPDDNQTAFDIQDLLIHFDTPVDEEDADVADDNAVTRSKGLGLTKCN